MAFLGAHFAFAAPGRTEGEQVGRTIAGASVPFIVNQGQLDRAVAFYAPMFSGTVYVTGSGQLVYSLLQGSMTPNRHTWRRWSLTEGFVGGSPTLHATDRAVTRVDLFLGNDLKCWRSDLPTYNSVELGEVWPGIKVSLRARSRSAEKIFTVAPGSSPGRIRLALKGQTSLRLNGARQLIAVTGLGEVVFSAPRAYQDTSERHTSIPVAYELKPDGYGFRLGAYDHTQPVYIDPLLQSTYLGGTGNELVQAVAVHPQSGEVLVAGVTTSIDFPGTTGGAQPALSGGSDLLIARFDPLLTQLLQATYLGGNGGDGASAMAVNPATGEIFLAGSTTSTDFPGAAGGAQANFGGGSDDAFVARLNSTLTNLLQCTYLGGNQIDFALALALRASGELLVAGVTISSDFPGTAGGAIATHGGGTEDGFVARLNSNLTSLLQASYLGGGGRDFARAVAVHPATGEILVVGGTSSANLPGAVGGPQPSFAGFEDAFATRLSSNLAAVLRSTYLGGGGYDSGYSITVNPENGEILVAGNTASSDFPGTIGGAQPVFGGSVDSFVARFDSQLSTLLQGTFLGGHSNDIALAVLTHPQTGEVLLAGYTENSQFPGTSGGAQASHGGGLEDAFAARLSSTLRILRQATYIGGSEIDEGWAMAIHPVTGEVIVGGRTLSTDFPSTTGGAQSIFGGSQDAFVARLTADLAAQPIATPTPTVTPTPVAPSVQVPTLSLKVLALLAFFLASLGFWLTSRVGSA
jgi:hypothetical protein